VTPEYLDDFAGAATTEQISLVWLGALKIGAPEFEVLSASELHAVTFEMRAGENSILMHLRGLDIEGAIDPVFKTGANENDLALLAAARELSENQRMLALFSDQAAWDQVGAALQAGAAKATFGSLHSLSQESADFYGRFSVA